MPSLPERSDLVTIAVADTTRIHTQLLTEAMHNDHGLQVVASASNSSDLLAAVTRVPVDVAVISHSLDDQPARGTEVLREMRALRPHIKGVILLDSSRPQDVLDCFRSGAKGIFSKHDRLENLSKCIRTVHEGQIWARSADLHHALEALATAPVVRATNQNGLELLSTRERQVIQHLAVGMTNIEIADSLGLSRHTVKNYLFRVFDKLGVSSRTELLSLTMNAQPVPEVCTCGESQRFSCVLEAAESGMLSAQLRLAEHFSKVDGHLSDNVSAYMWYLLAEKNAASICKRIEEVKKRLSESLSLEQRSEAENRAAERAKGKKARSASAGPQRAAERVLTGAT
jgi:DNA-binding NarL/FixJ family response regulator